MIYWIFYSHFIPQCFALFLSVAVILCFLTFTLCLFFQIFGTFRLGTKNKSCPPPSQWFSILFLRAHCCVSVPAYLNQMIALAGLHAIQCYRSQLITHLLWWVVWQQESTFFYSTLLFYLEELWKRFKNLSIVPTKTSFSGASGCTVHVWWQINKRLSKLKPKHFWFVCFLAILVTCFPYSLQCYLRSFSSLRGLL